MDSSIIRGSFPDEEDDLGLQHNRNIGNAGQSEDIIVVVEKAIKGMLERKRFGSSNVGSANYLESECVDQEECDSNIFGENRDTGISVSALSRPVGVAHNVQFDTDHHYGFAAATAEEIRLDNEVFVNDSDSTVRKDFIDHDESFIIDSDVLGSEDVSTEEVLDDLENQGQFEQLSICSLDDARKSNYGTNCFNNISRNDYVEEFPVPGKYASFQNFKKDNKRIVKLVTNSSKNSDVNCVEITPSIVYKNHFSQSKNLKKSDSLKQFYESVASNLADDKNDSLCVVQETSLLTPESNGLDEKKMPVLVNENDIIISPCEEERPPPKLIPQIATSELNPLNMIPPPDFTTKVNEQVIGVVHPFNHENNLNIDNQVSNISGVSILSSNGKPLNPPTEVITRNRLRSHCLDSVINAPRSMIKKQESFSTVIMKHDSLKTMAVSTMLNGSIDKSDYIPKEVKMRQGISSGNHYRSAHKGIKHINSEDKKEFLHVHDNRLTLTVPIHSVDKVPEILETSSVADKSFEPKKEFISKEQLIISESIRKPVHDNLEMMKNNKSNASYSTVCNVKTDKIIADENKKNSLQDKGNINMSALPSMPILLSPTMEETLPETPSTKTNKGENSRKIDHTNSGKKQAPARSVATPLRSFQRLPIAELSLSTPNPIKNTITKHKTKSKHDELLLSVSVANDNTISPVKQGVHNHIKATRLEENARQIEIDSNPEISQLLLNKIELNQEMAKSVKKGGLNKKLVNNGLVKNFHSPDLISSSLEPLTIETKGADSSFKTFDNLLTDLDLDKTQTNPLDESVHSLDPFIKDIQPAADILEVLPGADILDGGITDKEIIISSADVGLLKSDILEEEEQVLTLEDSTLSILNFFDKDLSSSKALECHENESFENPEKFSSKNDLSFTIPEIKFEEDKVILDRPESISNTNDEKSPVKQNIKLNDSIEEIDSKTKSTAIDDLILMPGTDNHDKINSKVLDGYYPTTPEQKKYDNSKSNLLSEIEKINEILDRELANTIDDEVVSDKYPQNPSSSSSSTDMEENKDLDKTRAAEIFKETNLQVDTLHEESKVSENCASDKSSEVPVRTCDNQLSSKEVVLSNSEGRSVVKNQVDGNNSLEQKKIQGTDDNITDANMSDKKDKSCCDIRSNVSQYNSNSKLSKDSSSFNIKSSAYKNNNTYKRKEPKIFIRSTSRKRRRKRKKSSEKHQKDNNLETEEKCDSKFGATISFLKKMTTSSDKFNLIPNGRVSPPKMDFTDVPCRRHKKFSINIEDYLCKPLQQNKVISGINDREISLPLSEKSESRNNLPDISKPNTVGKKGNEDNLIVNDLRSMGENEFSPRVSKEYVNVNRKQLVKSPQNNDLREKKAGLEAVIRKLKSEKNASDEYTEKWLIGENNLDLNVFKSNENVFEPENSDSLQSCSSKIETEIIHDNLDAQLEIELSSAKNVSIICKSEFDIPNDEKSCSDIPTTTHENLPDSSEKNIDSNLKCITPTGTNNSINVNVDADQNEKIIFPSEKNSSLLSIIPSVNSVYNSSPVASQQSQTPSSLVITSENSKSTSHDIGVESPTSSNLTTDKILPNESEFIEKGIPLIETNENCNKPHVLNEIETGKLNECVTINDNNEVNTISDLSENDKNTKHFLSKSSVDIPDIDQQHSSSQLFTNASALLNDSCNNIVSDVKVDSFYEKIVSGNREKDQNSSDKLPVSTNPPGLIDKLVRENKKESRKAVKDKNYEIASGTDSKSCALEKGNDSSSLSLEKKPETENIQISTLDAATKDIVKEDKDICMLNNNNDAVEKTVLSINQTNVSNSITKTTHKYVEPIVNIDNKKTYNERSKLELSNKTCIKIKENTNTSQDIESGIQAVVDYKDCVGAKILTDESVNSTGIAETNIKKECANNHKNVAEKIEEIPLCIEIVPTVDENATKKISTENHQSIESFIDKRNVIDFSEKTNLELNKNSVEPKSIESVNPTVSEDENGIDITDQTNLIVNTIEKIKTTDSANVTSTVSIVNFKNCINNMEETVTEKLQNKENASDSKSCMDVADTTENTLYVCNENYEKLLRTGSDNISNSGEEKIINIIEKTNEISASNITNTTDKSCSENIIPTVNSENCVDGNGEKVNEQLQSFGGINDESNVLDITKAIDEVAVTSSTEVTEETHVSYGSIEELQSIGSVNPTNIDEENIINDNREAFTEKQLSIDKISDEKIVIEVTKVTDSTEENTIIEKTYATEITKTTYKSLGIENVTPTVSEESGIDVTEKILGTESVNNETYVPEVTEENVEAINVIETTKITEQINLKNNNTTVSEEENKVNQVINITKPTEKTLPVNNENCENLLIVEHINKSTNNKDHDPNFIEETFTETTNNMQIVESDRVNKRNTFENIIVENIDIPQSVESVCRNDSDGKHNTNPSVETCIDDADEGVGNINNIVRSDGDGIDTTENVEKSLSKENCIVSDDENVINLTVKTLSENKQPCVESVNLTITEGMDVSLASEISIKSAEKCNIEEENSREVINSQVSSSENFKVRCDIESSLEVDSIYKNHLDCSSNPTSSELSIPPIESTECGDDINLSDKKAEKPAIGSSVDNLSTTSMRVSNEGDSVFELNNIKSTDKINKHPTDSSSQVLSKSASKDSIKKIDSDKILNEPTVDIDVSFCTEISYNNNNNTKEVDSDGIINVNTNKAEADMASEDSVDPKIVKTSIERNFPNQEKFGKEIKENNIEPNSLVAGGNQLVSQNLLYSSTSTPQWASEPSISKKPSGKRDKSAVLKTKCKIAIKNANPKLNSKALLHLQDSGSVKVKFLTTDNNDSSESTENNKTKVADSSEQRDPKDNSDPETFMHEYTKYIDSNNRFQTNKVTSMEGETSLLKNNENPAQSSNHQPGSVITNDDSPKCTNIESDIEDAVPVNLKSEVNNLFIDKSKPFIGTADSNSSNNTYLKGIQLPERSKNEVAKLPVDPSTSDFAPDTTIDNQVSSQSGTIDNLLDRPFSTSTEPKDSHPDKDFKNDLLLDNVINKMVHDTNTEGSPEHSYYSAPDSSGEQIINKKEHTGTDIDFSREQENVVKREDSCLKEQINMAPGNTEEQLKLEETRGTSVIESGASETFQEHATEELPALSESKLNSLSLEIYFSSHCSDAVSSKHSSLSINPSQLKLPNSVENCKSVPSMPEEIHESQVTDSVKLPVVSTLAFPDSTEPNPEIVEDSNNPKNLEPKEKKNLNQDDSSVKQEESVSNVIVANYFQSNILVEPTGSIILQHEKSSIDKKDVSESVDNDWTDNSVNKINLRPRVVSKKETVCKIKENDVSLSIDQNKEKGNKLKSDRQDEAKNKLDINITGNSVSTETRNNLRKMRHPNSVTSDAEISDKIVKSVLSTATQELPENCVIREVRVVLEKIVHPDNPNQMKFSANIEITDHKRKRQVLGHSEGVKRHSNTPKDQEEPPSKVLLLNSTKSVGGTPLANDNKKDKGKINSRSENAVLKKEKNEVHTDGNICSPASVILSRLNSLSNIRECMYKNKVKRVFLPSNVHSCLKKDTQQQSKYSDLEIICIDSTERNSRFKRRRRKSPLTVTDDESDEEDYSSRRRLGRTRLLNKRKRKEKVLSSIQSNRNANGPSLRSNAKNEKSTKDKGLLKSSSVHEGTVSSSMSAALSTSKRPHESEIGNEALPKKPNLSNEFSCSNNKPKTDNDLTYKKTIFAQETMPMFPEKKELGVEICTLPPGRSPAILKVEKTVKEILHNVVKIRYNQVAARDPQEEEDSDDDFMGFEDELPCGCLSESNATSQNCVGYCFIRKKLSYLRRTIELSSKHSSSSRRNERLCTFRPLRGQESGEEHYHVRSDKSVELHHETSANSKPFWNPGICYMSLGVEVRSHKKKDQDCFSSKNAEVTNRRTRQLARVSNRKPYSVTNTDMNYEEDSDSSS